MSFNPEKSLFDLPIIRTIALITGILSLVTFLTIAWHTRSPIQLDYLGFNQIIVMFKVPLGILAVGLSLVGICGANHRSEQTKTQIERTGLQLTLTRDQNNFANYYKHIEEFEKYCKNISTGKITVESSRELYRVLYPKSREGNFNACVDSVELFNICAQRFLHLVYEFDTPSRFVFALTELVEMRIAILRKFHIKQDHSEHTSGTFNFEGKSYPLYDLKYGTFLLGYTSLLMFIAKLIQFDINCKIEFPISILQNIDISGYRMRPINVYTPEPFEFIEVFGKDAQIYLSKNPAQVEASVGSGRSVFSPEN